MANYLYNGVELPALPEWDKDAYPYAFIYITIYGHTELKATNVRPYYNGETMSVLNYDCITLGIGSNGEWGVGFIEHNGWNHPSHVLPFWTNFDLLAEDGSVYLSASDPIPVSTFTPDPISMTMGWLVGRRIASQRGKYVEPDVPVVPDEPERQLIGYSYNGVVLPDINEVWTDKEMYPYALTCPEDGQYFLLLTTAAVVMEDGYLTAPQKLSMLIAALNDGVWEIVEEEEGVSQNSTFFMGDPTVWSNYDILNTDGTTYLAASEPVPVYES